MSEITEVIPGLGSPPLTTDPANFDTRADTLYGTSLPAVITSINTWRGQANTVAGEVNTNAISAAADAATASAFGNTSQWISGTTYAAGAVVWSPVDFGSYRRKTDGSGTTDPSLDPTNWTSLAVAGTEIIRTARTSNVELVAADSGGLTDVTSGTFSQTFAAASVLGDGWFRHYKNSGTGTVTLDPSGAETIDGAATLTVGPNSEVLITCNGTALFTAIRQTAAAGSSLALLATYTLSSTATLDIEDFSDKYDEYEIVAADLYFASRIFTLNLRLKLAGAYVTTSTYNNYRWAIGASTVYAASTATSFEVITNENATALTSEPDDAAAFPQEFRIRIPCRNSTRQAVVKIESLTAPLGSVALSEGHNLARQGGNGPIEGLRIYTGGGSLTSGTIRVYGVKK